MSIRNSLLALLSDGDAYGYQLRARFESATGSVWSLNIGQVYTTLSRLERDGLVEGNGAGGDGRISYRLTDIGRIELSAWWDSPVAHPDRPRDELAIKMALAVTTPGVDVAAIVQTQRRETIRHLQDLTRLKRQTDADDVSWRLVVESMIFAAEAEVRWLDHCEAAVLRGARKRNVNLDNVSGQAVRQNLIEGQPR
ncbi:MAG: PadR family transcriptional regulator [Nakamurella sp.]